MFVFFLKRYGVKLHFLGKSEELGDQIQHFFPAFFQLVVPMVPWSRDFLAMDESPAEAKEIFEKLQGDDSMVM